MAYYREFGTNKTYLITGGSGFLGKELVKHLYGKCKIRVFARNEGNLIKLQNEFPYIEIITGSLENVCEVEHAVHGVDGIFHLAAFKHVGMAETQSYECIKSNIVGTMNLLEATRNMNLEFIIGISTDKAAQVNGIYGASKLCMEHLFHQFAKFNESTKYRLVRYGNVLGSTGSVITKWIPLLQQGKQVIITDPNATRFFWSVQQAIDLIFECLDKAVDTTPYCPEMKSIRMVDMLLAAHKKYGVCNLDVVEIGLQSGENLHERIVVGGKYSNEVESYTVDEIMEMI